MYCLAVIVADVGKGANNTVFIEIETAYTEDNSDREE
jgi:hypothetical protein